MADVAQNNCSHRWENQVKAMEIVDEELHLAKVHDMKIFIPYLQALKAVLEMHKPSITKYINNFIGCDNCSSTSGFVLYPCPTVQAIEKALGVMG